MPCGGLPAWMPGSQSRNEVSWAGIRVYAYYFVRLLVHAAAIRAKTWILGLRQDISTRRCVLGSGNFT